MKANHPFKSHEAKNEYMEVNQKMSVAWPDGGEERFVVTSFGETFVRINGDPVAEPLVLLPGALACSLSWLPNIQALSENYRTYAVDTLINTGSVGRSVYKMALTSPREAVKWLLELLDSLDLKQPNIAGMSFGGMVASYLAIEYPHRLQRLVLIAPSILPLSARFVLHAIPALVIPSRRSFRNFLNWHLDAESNSDNDLLPRVIEMMVIAHDCFKSEKSPNPVVFNETQLRSIQAPTLLLIGENDRTYSMKKAIRSVQANAPGWQLEVIKNAGHALPLTQADVVNKIIVEFLS